MRRLPPQDAKLRHESPFNITQSVSISPLNPSSVFTPRLENDNSTTQRQGFLGHVHGLHAPQQLSPTTYVEVRDSNGAWHQVVAFFDSGSDTTLVKSSLAQRLGLVGTPEVFHYGVAGRSSMKENSARTHYMSDQFTSTIAVCTP